MTDVPPELDSATAVTIGRVVAPHGVRGEVRVRPTTDFPERFDAGRVVWLDDRPVRIEGSRWQRDLLLLKLEGIDDRGQAEAIRGHEFRVPEETLPEGVFYRHQVVGLRVVEESGRELGRVAEVLSTGANDVYVVHGEQGELLLPATDEVVKEIDVGSGRMVVELMEGLDFEPRKRPAPRRAPRRRGPPA